MKVLKGSCQGSKGAQRFTVQSHLNNHRFHPYTFGIMLSQSCIQSPNLYHKCPRLLFSYMNLLCLFTSLVLERQQSFASIQNFLFRPIQFCISNDKHREIKFKVISVTFALTVSVPFPPSTLEQSPVIVGQLPSPLGEVTSVIAFWVRCARRHFFWTFRFFFFFGHTQACG